MRKRRKFLAGVLAAALGVTTLLEPVPFQAEAAGKPALSEKKAVIQKGKKKTITVKNVKKSNISSLTVTVSKKKVAKVKKVSGVKFTVTGKKKGSTTVTVKVKLKKAVLKKKVWELKCKVTVKNAAKDSSENDKAVQTGVPDPVTETPQEVPAGTQVPGTMIPSPEVMDSEQSPKPSETQDGTTDMKNILADVKVSTMVLKRFSMRMETKKGLIVILVYILLQRERHMLFGII